MELFLAKLGDITYVCELILDIVDVKDLLSCGGAVWKSEDT